MKYTLRLALLLMLLLPGGTPARASHIVGGEMTYRFAGMQDTFYHYSIKLSIYEDCLTGSTSAIAADSLAFITTNDGAGNLYRFDSVPFTSTEIVPANFSSACVNNIPQTCLRRKDFLFDLLLPPNATGYTINYRRCCRNATIVNIFQPSNIGATYYCTIPPASIAASNNSAVFRNFPPQIICGNTPLVYDHSATDADGDSLSYELCNSLSCPNGNNIENNPFVPPYTYVQYLAPFSYAAPMTAYPPLNIDARTGIISGTPNHLGRYLVTVCCNEWRHGVIINTTRREFQFVVTGCTKSVVADIPVLTAYPNTFELDCRDYTIHFINTSSGGRTWLWDFGVPGGPHDTTFEPTYIYPDTGTFAVKLVVNPGTTCTDSVIRLVRVFPVFRAGIVTNDTQCVGNVVKFFDNTADSSHSTFKWKWYFGDGDTSLLQNPRHTYSTGGSFDVIHIAGNGRDCIDTTVREIIVEMFTPSAGNDTTIVKNETVQFHATGGISYLWTPSNYLINYDLPNPVGYYPDTGKFNYAVRVVSPYGCIGTDSFSVTVVDHASFAVPNAFTPNGDGRNDRFKPYAVGYKTLNYFRVFNRWGQEVYFTTSFETGWDGTYHGSPADIGTYFWEIGYTDRFGKTGTTKGDVLLAR